MGLISGSKTVEIDAPLQVCFDIAADIEGAPAWQGSLKTVDVLERDEVNAREAPEELVDGVEELLKRLAEAGQGHAPKPR